MKKLLAILLLLPTLAFAKGAPVAKGGPTEDLFGAWGTATFTGRVAGSNFLWYGEGSARATDSVKTSRAQTGDSFDIHAMVGRAAVGYELTPRQKVLVGYAYQETESPYSKVALSEHRAWEQHEFKHTFDNKDSLSFRTRLEERTTDVSSDTAVRFREQVKYAHALTNKLSLVASEEIFANVNKTNWGPVSGFDQNRGFVGVGYKLNDHYKTEIGYMNQYLNRENNYDRMVHMFNISLVGDYI